MRSKTPHPERGAAVGSGGVCADGSEGKAQAQIDVVTFELEHAAVVELGVVGGKIAVL